jgi:hypothetical protein
MPRVTHLTVREGDGDAERTGYWLVTGPQPEHDAYATIEREREYLAGGSHRDGFGWYLRQRQQHQDDRQSSVMVTVRHGQALTYQAALSELQVAWVETFGGGVPVTDDTAEVVFPWRDN